MTNASWTCPGMSLLLVYARTVAYWGRMRCAGGLRAPGAQRAAGPERGGARRHDPGEAAPIGDRSTKGALSGKGSSVCGVLGTRCSATLCLPVT